MPTAEKEESGPETSDVRDAGVARSPGERLSTDLSQAVLSLETLRVVGNAMYGTHWQADLAKDLMFHKSLFSRWLKGERPLPRTLQGNIRAALLDRMAALAKCVLADGMGADPRTVLAMRQIIGILARLRPPPASDEPA